MADSLAQPIDTATAARLGLPTGPSRNFPAADSMIRELLQMEGYRTTRYSADSLAFLAPTREINLVGASLLEREGMTLEADSVEFLQGSCTLNAVGEPKIFESGTVLIGNRMAYDTCENQGLVLEALTNFEQSGVDWYLRGGLGIDSAATRLYAGDGEITSCDQPEAHYHFDAGRVKWVSNSFMVARPVTLYVRDVPVLWLPFIFQDMRQGRRSGILTPRFGINDLVRPNEGYRRHITNMGYYFAISDYLDAQASVDWFAKTSVTLNGELRYRWLNQFMSGGVAVSRIFESGQDDARGRRATQLSWNHRQSFNQRTSLNANVQFATSSSVVEQNSVDPYYQTATLQSSLNFSKQADWGTINLGGRGRQDLSNGQVQITFPDIRLTPVPLSVGSNLTWSPSFALSTNRTLNQQVGTIALPPIDGIPQENDTIFADNRVTTLNFATPIRIGSWNWQNSFTVRDVMNDRRSVRGGFEDPDDSTSTLSRVYGEEFSTEIDWNTGINLPMLFPGSWKLQPSLGIQNATTGPFILRNEFTGGEFVQQGKRLSFSAGISPALFGFFPGIGPLERIRHSISPQVRWNYAPSATVNEAYARARNPTATDIELTSNPLHTLSFGLSQTFEGKFESPEGDSADTRDARKLKILQIQTSSIQYDFERAKEPGKNGWRTQTLSNSVTSDLLRGFSLRFSHDLWDGPVGDDTTDFDPFLQNVSARFSIRGATIARLFRSLTGGDPSTVEDDEPEEPDTLLTGPQTRGAGFRRGTSFPTADVISGRGARRGGGFTASVTYDDQRRRPREGEEDNPLAPPTTNRTLGFNMQFSPTENWGLSWNTQYNFTTGEFGQHVLRLDRDMHRWRATFAVVKAPNGNFAFNFFVNLLDQPEIKFNYDQRDVN